MKYINKIDWKKVESYRAQLSEKQKYIIAFTSTNEGTKEKPSYNAHILNNNNTISPLGLIDINRLISMGEKYNVEIPLLFGINEYDGKNWQDFMRRHLAYFMDAVKVRTAIIYCIKDCKIIKIEHLV
jgi:hypothetical protein